MYIAKRFKNGSAVHNHEIQHPRIDRLYKSLRNAKNCYWNIYHAVDGDLKLIQGEVRK